MTRTLVLVLAATVACPAVARAQLVFDGDVPTTDTARYFTIPFEVPAGTVEIEIRHDDLSSENILDWGLLAPSGFRGYGGGNTEAAIVGVDAASRSYLTGPIEAGTWEVYVGEAAIEETPARYHVEIDLRTAPTLAPETENAPYAPVPPLSIESRWYAGDFHVHSRESGDASPTLDEIAEYAEGVGLDFVMLSEHNTTSQLELLADVQARHPNLLFLPGIEVTTYEGHFMSIGGTTWIDHRTGTEGRTLDDVAADVHADEALFTVNHPELALGSMCIGCAWSGSVAPTAIDGMEIQTGAFSVTGSFLSAVIERWEELALMGEHVAAIGGSDDHRAGTGTGAFDSPIGSPTTMVYADELSVSAILAGVRAGRTVVRLEGNDDPMIELGSADLEGDAILADTTVLVVRVTNGDGTSLRLVRDGERGAVMPVTGDDFVAEIPVLAGAGTSAIRAELVSGVRMRALTSHVFLSPITPGGPDGGPVTPDAGPAAPPASGCGCRTSSGSASPFALLSALLLLAARRR